LVLIVEYQIESLFENTQVPIVLCRQEPGASNEDGEVNVAQQFHAMMAQNAELKSQVEQLSKQVADLQNDMKELIVWSCICRKTGRTQRMRSILTHRQFGPVIHRSLCSYVRVPLTWRDIVGYQKAAAVKGAPAACVPLLMDLLVVFQNCIINLNDGSHIKLDGPACSKFAFSPVQ
jgi:hypothetical protein